MNGLACTGPKKEPALTLKPSVACTLPKILLLAEFHEMLAQAEILTLLLFPTFKDSNKLEVLSENETTDITFRIRKMLISY